MGCYVRGSGAPALSIAKYHQHECHTKYVFDAPYVVGDAGARIMFQNQEDLIITSIGVLQSRTLESLSNQGPEE